MAVMVPQRGPGGLSQRPGTTGPVPGPLQSQGVPPTPSPVLLGSLMGQSKFTLQGEWIQAVETRPHLDSSPWLAGHAQGLCFPAAKPLTPPAPLCPTRGVSLTDSAAGTPWGEPLDAERPTT